DRDIEEGLVLFFDGSGSRDNVGVVNWTWSFIWESIYGIDKEVMLYGISPSYHFSRIGIFEVFLNVSDVAGNSAEDRILVWVRDVTQPVANAGPDQRVKIRTIVLLDGSGSRDNVGVVNWTWSFETANGTEYLFGKFAEYNFTVVGNYTIHLIVNDAEGNSAEAACLVEVYAIEEKEIEEDKGSILDHWWVLLILILLIECVYILFIMNRKRSRETIHDADDWESVDQ
ncbi:MAG: PKD domain-containing protein, partial [Candidatus Thermoplasmatota archaeon]|nr:PKD domain-containing protein [Candidatus Thermoplasmatota archaeon]